MQNNKPKVLMKNNMIVKAKYNLNIIENRMFQLILYKAQSVKGNSDLLCKVSHDEFKEIIKKRNDFTIKAIGETLEEKLRKSSIEIMTNNKWYKYGFINGFTFDATTNIFEIKIDAEIYRLLFDYLKGYTPVNLAIFFSFKTYYSQRFYELLRLWSNKKHVITYTFHELKEILMLEDKYSEYRDFKRRIITPSIKELNEKSLMQIEIKENKIGRKVNSISFIVTDLDKRKYFDQNDKDNEQREDLKKCKKLKCMNFDERTYDYKDLERKLLGWTED